MGLSYRSTVLPSAAESLAESRRPRILQCSGS